MSAKTERRIKIKFRVRNKISGTPERPRMSVFRSNKQIYVQIIDDLAGKTLAAASSRLPRLVSLLHRMPRRQVSPQSFSTVTVSCTMVELRNWPMPHVRAVSHFKLRLL